MDYGFLQRQARRKATQDAARQELKHRRAQRVDYLCRQYEDAYFTWTKEHVRVRYSNGRYYPGRKSFPVKEAMLIQLTNNILAKIHAEEMPAVE